MNLTLWKPEAHRAERRMGTMRKYPGCSPIARPSRSNVFFSQSSMKVARHRLILLSLTTDPCKTPSTGSPSAPQAPHCGKPLKSHGMSLTRHYCPSHGPSLRQTGAWRLAARAFACCRPGTLPLWGGATLAPLASLSAGQVCPRPGMCVSRTTDLVLGIPEAQPSPKIT